MKAIQEILLFLLLPLAESTYDDQTEDDNMLGVVHYGKIWTSNQILYTYERYSRFTEEEKRMIRKEMDSLIMNLTPGCLEFEERQRIDLSVRHIEFKKLESKCNAHVGRKEVGKTEILLSPDCFITPGTIMHELIHSVGVYHEMNRPDRDLFLDVDEAMIEEEHLKQFHKKNTSTYDLSNLTPYDVFSIMNYHETQGCKAGTDCIKVKEKFRNKLKRDDFYPLEKPITWLSATDIVDISNRYSCPIFPDIEVEHVNYTLAMIEIILDYVDEECAQDIDSMKCKTLKFEAYSYLVELESVWKSEWENHDQLEKDYCNLIRRFPTEEQEMFSNENMNSWFKKYGRDI